MAGSTNSTCSRRVYSSDGSIGSSGPAGTDRGAGPRGRAPAPADSAAAAPTASTAPAAPAAPKAPQGATAPKVPRVAAAPSLDLNTLERRLKKTNAVGVLTKLSLKNQVDDLVQRFRAFHHGQRPPGIAELRPAFDLLLMKVLWLLQDKDPALARDIDTRSSSRPTSRTWETWTRR